MVQMGRRTPLIALAALTLAGCGSGEAAAPPAPASTVGDVGALPGELPSGTDDEGSDDVISAPTAAPTATADPMTTEQTSPRGTTTTTTGPARPSAQPAPQPVGRTADGNRVLMIGDSILAATAERYTGEMCDRLVPMGWAVEVDAQTGSPIEFGHTVLDRRLDAGWDAVVILLGTNYNGNAPGFAESLEGILDELEPIPVLLLTVSQYEERQAEVNYVIRSLGREYDNVRVLEWAERTADDERLLRGDGIHPSDEGRQVLVSMISQALGRAPLGGEGADCLPTRFTNDSGS